MDVNCGVYYYDGAVADTVTTNSACILGGSTGETVASATDVSDGCKNALASVCFTVSTCQVVLSSHLVAPASLQLARAAQDDLVPPARALDIVERVLNLRLSVHPTIIS